MRSMRPQPAPSLLLAILAAAVALAGLGGCGVDGRSEADASPHARPAQAAATASVEDSETVSPFRFYSPHSFWNKELRYSAPLDPESGPIVTAFTALVEKELREKDGPSINTTEYSVPIYTVPAQQPTVKVKLDAPNAPALQEAWDAVPMPANAKPAKGTDRRLVVWQPATDKLWEFWRAERREGAWHASWGGATQNVTSASGVPDPASWPGAQPWWGGSACSLGMVGGLITLEDLEQGVINHALQIAIPNVRAGVFASPALRTDGKAEDPLALPEGAHLRLDPNVGLAYMHLPRLTLMMARAAKRYGIYVINGSQDVAFQAQDPTPTGSNPYLGESGYFEGSYPQELLARFPWNRLQLLNMELHPYSR
jgi:hypothetical protein